MSDEVEVHGIIVITVEDGKQVKLYRALDVVCDAVSIGVQPPFSVCVDGIAVAIATTTDDE